MKVAVIGAGYAGLAVTWNLLQRGFDVTVFDGGKGASHVSTGLLHPCPGRHAIPTLRAEEGMQATRQLLDLASSDGPVYLNNGILRIATNEEQKRDFGGDTLWIPEGITVFSQKYLDGLKKACKKAQFVSQWVEKGALQDFDAAILTTGAETLDWAPLPLSRTLGQSLLCRWKEPLSMSLLSYGHITPTDHPDYCQIGSTYEHTAVPDPQKARELLEKAAHFYPPAKDFEIVDIRCGVRIAPKVGYLPYLGRLDEKTWVFTGLGSRGLIYHALYAKILIEQEFLVFF